MRTIFATRPIGQIVAGLCRDLGITRTSELWPADFIAITETLPQWCARTLPPTPAAANANTNPRRADRSAHTPPPRRTPATAAPSRPPRPIAIRPVRSG